MERKEVLKLLERENELIQKSAEKSAIGLADRDYLTYDFKKRHNDKMDKTGNWMLWFAYWLGREHGRQTAINNARIYIKDGEAIVKSLLRGLWIIR